MKRSVAVIGAGLTGLYAAYRLKDTYDVTLFEARPRTGGRIYTVEGFDLGPSWIWPHQQNILWLIHTLRLDLFPQYDRGLALYETPRGIERFQPPPSQRAARIEGGIGALVDALAGRLHSYALHLGEPVRVLRQDTDSIAIETSKRTRRFDAAICTLPPRLAAQALTYDPPLPPQHRQAMQATPTWMAHTAKCVVEFAKPFWRSAGLSGFCISHAGPLAEIHDACTPQRAALFGFVSNHADMATIRQTAQAQLERLFGGAAAEILSFHCIDWREERFTATESDTLPRSEHPAYGPEITHFNDRLLFAGTETARIEGGYLEGAINSVRRVIEQLETLLEN